MKKIFKLIIILFLCVVSAGCTNFVDVVKEKLSSYMPNENTITIFYRDDCKYCNQLSEYLDSQDESVKKQLKIKKYNVNEQENKDLFNQKVEELGLSNSRIGVPFIVIGDNYLIGFNKENFNEFILENLNITLSQNTTNISEGYYIYTYEANLTETYANSFVTGDYLDIYVLYSDLNNKYISKYFTQIQVVDTKVDSSLVKLDLALSEDDYKSIQIIEKNEKTTLIVLPRSLQEEIEEIDGITNISREEMDQYIK